MADKGTLYIVATPIGNLGDITLRALEVLRSVDIIAAEDTRHTLGLLNHYEINVPLTSYHEHNKYEKAQTLIAQLLSGKCIALVTDAGTPVISDPGEVLAAEARKAGITVTALPGACALIDALVISGLPARRFAFEGFLPAERKERTEALERIAAEERTVIMYEAPHHLKTTLSELYKALGDRRIVLARELTKIHEEAAEYTLSEAVEYYAVNEPKGEYVLVLEGKEPGSAKREAQRAWLNVDLTEHLEYYLSRGLDKKEAMKQMALDRGVPKKEIYKGLLEEEA